MDIVGIVVGGVATVFFFVATWVLREVYLRGASYTAPLRDRRGMAARARHTFYVVTEDGHLVTLVEALAELGLISDGGK